MKTFWDGVGYWEVTKSQQHELAYEAEGLWWLAAHDENQAFAIIYVRSK